MPEYSTFPPNPNPPVEPIVFLDLDFSYEGPRPFSTPEVQIILKAENGPAGGNPLYTLIGTRPALRAWLGANYCRPGEAENPEFYLGRAVPPA